MLGNRVLVRGGGPECLPAVARPFVDGAERRRFEDHENCMHMFLRTGVRRSPSPVSEWTVLGDEGLFEPMVTEYAGAESRPCAQKEILVLVLIVLDHGTGRNSDRTTSPTKCKLLLCTFGDIQSWDATGLQCTLVTGISRLEARSADNLNLNKGNAESETAARSRDAL